MTHAPSRKVGPMGWLWEKAREHASNAVIGGGILVGAFIVIAIVAIVGAAMLLAGKLSQSSRLASGGGMILLWTGPVAAILGGINGYILWSQTAVNLGF